MAVLVQEFQFVRRPRWTDAFRKAEPVVPVVDQVIEAATFMPNVWQFDAQLDALADGMPVAKLETGGFAIEQQVFVGFELAGRMTRGQHDSVPGRLAPRKKQSTLRAVRHAENTGQRTVVVVVERLAECAWTQEGRPSDEDQAAPCPCYFSC